MEVDTAADFRRRWSRAKVHRLHKSLDVLLRLHKDSIIGASYCYYYCGQFGNDCDVLHECKYNVWMKFTLHYDDYHLA
jgi:hypothetical protein